MNKYNIYQTISGVDFGIYQGKDENEAWKNFLKDGQVDESDEVWDGILIVQNEYGSVNFGGTEYFLEQDAYISEHGHGYEALARDIYDNYFRVEWDTFEDFDPYEDEDESNACDWDNPDRVIPS